MNTLRQRAEEQERAAFDARLAAAVNESRAAFLSSMTHNLRTPLASIKASVSHAGGPDRAPIDDPHARLAGDHACTTRAERLERLVTKVLELSRIHAGSARASSRADRHRAS